MDLSMMDTITLTGKIVWGIAGIIALIEIIVVVKRGLKYEQQ